MTTKIKASRIDQTQAFSFANVVANTITVGAGIIANGTLGAAGDLLVSNGTHAYWKSSNQLIPAAINGDKGQKGDKGELGTKGDLGTTGAKGEKGDGSTITLAGSNTELQFNDSGSLGADSTLNYNKTTHTLAANNIVVDHLTINNTQGVYLPTGNTAQRGTPNAGIIRYNSETGFAEIYTSAGWATFGAVPPILSSVSPTTYNGALATVFTITGSNITSDAVVKFVTAAGNTFNAAAVGFVNSTSVTATTPRNFTVADEPLSVILEQISGQSSLVGSIDCGSTPSWTTSSGTLTTAYYPANAVVATAVTATDSDANTVITYAVTTGSLPSGLTLNTSNGAITGNAANPATSSLTTTFGITASDQAGNLSTERSFNIITKWQDGSSSTQAAANASVIYSLSSTFQTSAANGKYWIKLPGQASASQVYCVMDSRVDGGGWMLIFAKTSSMNGETFKQLWFANTTWTNTTATQDSVLYPVLPNNISFGGLGFTKQMFNNQHPSWITNKGNYHWYDLQANSSWSLSGSKTVNSYVVSSNTVGSAVIWNRQQAWSGGSDNLDSVWQWWADSGNGGLCGGANQCGTLACPSTEPSAGCHTNNSYPLLIFVK